MRKPLLFKRFFDICAALFGLAAFSPILLVVAVLVRRKLGSPVLFRQVRPGLGGKPFMLYKFRTMRDAVDSDGQPLSDAERLTSFGSRLRRFSLDELPQLWNVLLGDMSIVGPRPLLMEYLPLYSPEQARRHDVRPGVTGWAQVNGRNAIGWDDRFKLDVWYVDHVSFILDMKIIFMTIGKALRGSGVDQPGGVTMEKFRGNENGRRDSANAR